MHCIYEFNMRAHWMYNILFPKPSVEFNKVILMYSHKGSKKTKKKKNLWWCKANMSLIWIILFIWWRISRKRSIRVHFIFKGKIIINNDIWVASFVLGMYRLTPTKCNTYLILQVSGHGCHLHYPHNFWLWVELC